MDIERYQLSSFSHIILKGGAAPIFNCNVLDRQIWVY